MRYTAEPANILEGPMVGQKASEGQTINLTCQVFGSPKPLIVWMKGQEQLTGGRFTIMEDGNLQISVSTRTSLSMAVFF
jgi:neuronal cell adhesion molecule